MQYLINHAKQPIEWRGRDKNIKHRDIINGEMGTQSITIWETFLPTDTGAPMHIHPHEETITVLKGRLVARIGDDRVEASEGETIYMPANIPHGIRSTGNETAHLLILFPVANVKFDYVNSKYNSKK